MHLFQRLSRRWGGRPNALVQAPDVQETCEIAAVAPHEGLVDELSVDHVAGWIRNSVRLGEHVDYEVVLPETAEVLARACANQFKWGRTESHGFYTRFSRTLSEPERLQAIVRPAAGGNALKLSPWLRTAYEPVVPLAMDVVDNCNLRCPFCLYDYAAVHTTHFMTEDTIDAALRFLPYTPDGNFWFSCLHEPTLHPYLTRYIDKAPLHYRQKIFYTTNLAKRMPSSYFEWLAESKINHVNVSIESLEPAVYERMRKGASHRIFQQNWDLLLGAFKRGTKPPRLRYIVVVNKSNLHDLPTLTKHLLDEKMASQVELRYIFDAQHIASDFKTSEYLDTADWIWLRDQLAGHGSDQVQLFSPPTLDLAPPTPRESGRDSPRSSSAVGDSWRPRSGQFLPGRYELLLSWDGRLQVNRRWAVPYDDAGRAEHLLTTNIREIADVRAFLDALPN